MGESFGAWNMGSDAALMPFVSSANIACGFHAGDPKTIFDTVKLAVSHDVAIGAHPSYPDLQGFGRRAMDLRPREVYHLVAYQVAAVKGICEATGARLHHVKPHGALYNTAAANALLATAIAEAVRDIDSSLVLYGLSGSHLVSQAERLGLRAAAEVFADRTYQNDGSLTPRIEDNALITDSAAAVSQVTDMILRGRVTATNGEEIELRAETVCIHGDGEHALEFAKALRAGLDSGGIEVKRFL